MYEVQSLRGRFGELLLRMKNNIAKTDAIFAHYNGDKSVFPEFVTKNLKEAQGKLGAVNQNFLENFNPEEYIKKNRK